MTGCQSIPGSGSTSASAAVVRPAPRSMTIPGTIAEWQLWTGMSFPDGGADVVQRGGTSPVSIDHARDQGVYFDQNVWIVHDLGLTGRSERPRSISASDPPFGPCDPAGIGRWSKRKRGRHDPDPEGVRAVRR